MLRLLRTKLLQVLPVLVVVSFATTALTDLIPGTPATLILGDYATPAAIAKTNHEYGFDQPTFERYWHWLTHALQGNLGRSITNNEPVAHLIGQYAPVTLELVVLALVVSLALAIPLSIASAARAERLFDRAVTALSSGLLSVPIFVTSVLIVYFLAVKTTLLPPNGWVSLSMSLTENLRHAVLPVAVLAIAILPLFTRVLRGDLVTVLQEDFIVTAQARGLPTWYILTRHALRPASLSLFTLTGLVIGYLFAGAIIVETFFGLPGLGLLVSQSVYSKDLPVVQGIVICVAVALLFVNICIDLSYALIDPRIRVLARP
jgi:peptide/nickel transport system permease protein